MYEMSHEILLCIHCKMSDFLRNARQLPLLTIKTLFVLLKLFLLSREKVIATNFTVDILNKLFLKQKTTNMNK